MTHFTFWLKLNKYDPFNLCTSTSFCKYPPAISNFLESIYPFIAQIVLNLEYVIICDCILCSQFVYSFIFIHSWIRIKETKWPPLVFCIHSLIPIWASSYTKINQFFNKTHILFISNKFSILVSWKVFIHFHSYVMQFPLQRIMYHYLWLRNQFTPTASQELL